MTDEQHVTAILYLFIFVLTGFTVAGMVVSVL